MDIVKATHDEPILLGRQGEKGVTRVKFNLLLFIQQYGQGTPQLLVKRAGEAVIYPATLTVSGTKAYWDIGAEWTATAGRGYCELNWYVGDALAKSEMFGTQVLRSLEGETLEEAPDPAEGYVAEVLDAAAQTLQAAEEVKGYAVHQPVIGENGNWNTWDGEAYEDTGKPSRGASGRGIESISYDRNKGVWSVRYTDNTYQTFSGTDPLTGKFVYFNDNFIRYPHTTADGMIEKYSDFRYNSDIKTARFTGTALEMTAVGASKSTTDSVGVYYSGKPVTGEVVIEFDFKPTLQGGKNTPFLEVRLLNSKIWCRINRVGLNWWCVSTASGLDIPSTPVADRLSFNYERLTTYRVRITVKEGELAVKSWKASEAEPLTDYDNTISLVSDLIDKQLLAEEYEPLLVFGQINDISNPNASFACCIDNYTAYKV